MSKIYFDTTPLIYFLDDEKPFSDKVLLLLMTIKMMMIFI